MVASATYLWNDSFDWRADLAHPQKRNRPMASGQLKPSTGRLWALFFLAAGLTSGFALNKPTGVVLLAYVITNVLYTVWLKHQVIVDLMCIALGFIFRVMAGATAINVTSSHWLLMCAFLLALYLAIAKRRHEILLLDNSSPVHRRVLQAYTVPWLDHAGTLLAAATIVSYALYTVSPETIMRFETDRLIYTLPFVVYGILRYLHLVHSSQHTGDPTKALFSDRWLLGCVGLWAVTCIGIIYL
jgi:4-hydroxybenzoate polyprenyltransferase